MAAAAPPRCAWPANLAIDLLRAAEPMHAPLPEGVVGLYGAIGIEMFVAPRRRASTMQ